MDQAETELMIQTFLDGLGFGAPVIVGAANLVARYNYRARTPFGVQYKTIGAMVSYFRGYNLNGLGTGKTFCTLAAFDILRSLGYVSRLLVAAPLSTLRFVWVAEVIRAFPHLKIEVVYGTKQKRLQALERDADIYVINHDGIATIQDELLWRADIDALAVDELAVYRNGSAKRTKLLRTIAAPKKWVWGLTGSPMPRDVTDVWGQATIITPHTVPKYFTHLRHQLCFKDGPFKWRAREGAVEQAVGMMRPGVRFSLDEVTELPSQVIQYVPVSMGKKQGEIYKSLKQQAIAMVGDAKIDALNAGAVLNKLLQIALGWVYARDGRVIKLDNEERVDTLLEYIDGTQRKAMVLLPFKHALSGVSAALTKENIPHFVVSGDTPAGKRNEIFDAFQNGSGKEPLVAHPACLAHGITLTAADTIIWGGPTTSLEIFLQANARIRRIGQTHKQLIVLLGGTPVEQKIYSLLGDNELTQNKFLSLLSSE